MDEKQEHAFHLFGMGFNVLDARRAYAAYLGDEDMDGRAGDEYIFMRLTNLIAAMAKMIREGS